MRELWIEALNSIGLGQIFEAENGQKALVPLRRMPVDLLRNTEVREH